MLLLCCIAREDRRSPRRKLQDFQLDATEAEVQIGQALDVQGNDLPLETAH